jgi:serine/threonine protein kinase
MTTVVKAGRYEIVGEVGRGAMGVVYKAVDPVIGRTVAVKTIRLSAEGTGLTRSELLARFQTEARAAGLLTHPNIVVVYDAGEEDGLYYITMEMVEGKSLQALIDEGQKFSLPRVLRIMEQTCGALQFAHERHVVHRDIKPANLMLTADDTVKVTDFGTAKILQFGTVQQTTHVMGTPSYMSPEQVKGRAVDGRSDIFSLGVMLYEMVTGEKPFPGQNITTVIYKIVNEDPVPPRQLDPAIHPGISEVIMRALCKEPENRYQSCREMLEDLRNYRSSAFSGNPQSTMALHAANPGATVAVNNSSRAGAFANESQVASTVRALSSRSAGPGQTPVVRRTGSLAPVVVADPPKSKGLLPTVFFALLLLGVIAWGANKIKPVFLAAQNINAADATQNANSGATPAVQLPDTAPAAAQSSATPPRNVDSPAPTIPKTAAPVTAAPLTAAPIPAAANPPVEASLQPAATTPEKPAAKPAETAKPELTLSAKAAQYKSRIENVIASHGLQERVKVQGFGASLTLAGKLRPSEHGALLKFLRDSPPDIRVIDHIEYDDAPLAASAAGAVDEGAHPVAVAGRGAIHVVTDVIGATATLFGAGGHAQKQCQTPCSFTDLVGKSFSLEVKKDGYRTVQTALNVKPGEVVDQKINLESLAIGLKVISDPPGATVFINGAKQSGQTPVVLPLAAGQYDIVMRLSGYSAYSSHVQVTDNVQTELSVQLHAKDTSREAWADVTTTPKGAEIVVDGTTTSQYAPARVQLIPGVHTITLKMRGFQPSRTTVQVSEGGTVQVQANLKPDK